MGGVGREEEMKSAAEYAFLLLAYFRNCLIDAKFKLRGGKPAV